VDIYAAAAQPDNHRRWPHRLRVGLGGVGDELMMSTMFNMHMYRLQVTPGCEDCLAIMGEPVLIQWPAGAAMPPWSSSILAWSSFAWAGEGCVSSATTVASADLVASAS
jgi:hypothetical protein